MHHCHGSAGALLQWRPVNNPSVRSSDGASSACSVLLSGAIYPSISSPNGTSKSIKTIITANSTESKEIILGHQRKHGLGVWIYLSREQLDVHLARQPITVSIFCICLVWIHWWPQQGFFSGESQLLPRNEPAVVWPCRCCILSSLGGTGNLFSGKQKSMSDCVRLGTDLISGHVFTLTMV